MAEGDAQSRFEFALSLLAKADEGDREAGAAELVELAHGVEPGEALRPHFVKLLGDATPNLRAAGCAGLALLAHRPEAAEMLKRALRDLEAPVRREAARSLASWERADLAEVLRSALTDSDAQVAFESALGLSSLHQSSGADVLLKALDNPVRRFAALSALARICEVRAREPAERLLKKFFASDFDRAAAAGLLAKLGVEAGRDYLLERLRKRRADDRGLAMELCGEHGVRASIPLMRQAIGDRRDPFRGAAARSLGLLGEDPSGETLGRLARDATEEIGVRCDAMEGLMFLGTAGAIAQLESLAQSGESEEVREAAREALQWRKEHP